MSDIGILRPNMVIIDDILAIPPTENEIVDKWYSACFKSPDNIARLQEVIVIKALPLHPEPIITIEDKRPAYVKMREIIRPRGGKGRHRNKF